MKKYFISIWLLLSVFGCSNKKANPDVPVIGFLDFIEDGTIALAKKGFFDALEKEGFSEKDSTIEVVYANAQGDIPTLGQACDLILSKLPALVATNVTLSTITAVQRTKTVPIFMMVSPRPDLAKLTNESGDAPINLFGVYETLEYLDTAVNLINQLLPNAKVVGTIYNQAEPQSVAAFEKLKAGCERLGMEIKYLPVNISAETQLVTQALLNKEIDVFFALPDNVIFASFETIVKSCNDKNIPVFTSEAGLVSRGAVASFGADFYQWGYQAGEQAAIYLKSIQTKKGASVNVQLPKNLHPEIVKIRKCVYNQEAAEKFNIVPGDNFEPYK